MELQPTKTIAKRRPVSGFLARRVRLAAAKTVPGVGCVFRASLLPSVLLCGMFLAACLAFPALAAEAEAVQEKAVTTAEGGELAGEAESVQQAEGTAEAEKASAFGDGASEGSSVAGDASSKSEEGDAPSQGTGIPGTQEVQDAREAHQDGDQGEKEQDSESVQEAETDPPGSIETEASGSDSAGGINGGTGAESGLHSLGVFKLTAYCSCPICSEQYGTKTAIGTRCTVGRTIAVDPKVIPYGTHVLIGDHVYTAEDCGGAVKGTHIDIYMPSHGMTDKWGVRYGEVFVVQ